MPCRRLVSVTDSEGTTSYTYDTVGNRTSTTYPNGVVTTYGYNSINALVSEVTTDSEENVLASYEYTIGANGERLSCTELGRIVEYTYDALERLTSETVTVGSEVSVTTYTYDSNSNRLSMNRDGEVTNYTYNSLNQITLAGDVSYTWDNAGNLVSQSRNGVIAATYTYDCHNRMISADINNISENIVESYTYDYLGNRTSKTSNGETTYFTTDLSTGYSQVLKAESSSETFYYTRGFELISRRAGQDAHYYLFDGGMSVRGLTDETGAITDTFVFDAFGNEVARTGTTDNSYGFQGEEKDATGLYYLRARYMDPSTGTFTSMDTYAGSLSDPMSLHKYLFANSNPVKYCDPSGHFSLVEMSAVMGIMGSVLCASTYYMLGEYNHVEKDSGYYAGLVTCFIIGAVIGAIAGYYFLYMYGIIANSIMLRLICYITLLIGGIYVGELSRRADETNNDLLAAIYAYIGWLSVLYGLLGIIDDGSTALSKNKRGAVGVGSSDSGQSRNDESDDAIDWDAVVSRSGETRGQHVANHESNDLSKPNHGVFYGDAQTVINNAWNNRANGTMMTEGTTDIYVIPYANAGYSGGYTGQGENLNYVTIITQTGTNNIITGYPGSGPRYQGTYSLIGG